MYLGQPEAQHSYCIWDAHTTYVTYSSTYTTVIPRHLQYNTAILLIISKDKNIPGLENSITVDKDTIQINAALFWKGNQRGTSKTTNPETLYIHMSSNCTTQEILTIKLITQLRHVSTYAHEKRNIEHPVFAAPPPKTPTSIHSSLSGTATTEQRNAIRIGILTQLNIVETIAKGTPATANLNTCQQIRIHVPTALSYGMAGTEYRSR
jgi:hypothetical protein